MCLAVPGRIVKIKSDIATIDYSGEKRTARIIDGKYDVGDFVLVSAKVIVQKIPEAEALECLRVLQDAA